MLNPYHLLHTVSKVRSGWHEGDRILEDGGCLWIGDKVINSLSVAKFEIYGRDRSIKRGHKKPVAIICIFWTNGKRSVIKLTKRKFKIFCETMQTPLRIGELQNLRKPDYRYEKVTKLSPQWLKEHNIHAVVTDFDNTFSKFHGKQLPEGVSRWIDSVEKECIPVFVASNGGDQRLADICKYHNLTMIPNDGVKKPDPKQILEILADHNIDPAFAVMVGDRKRTDIVAGNSAGMVTVLVKARTKIMRPLKSL